MNNDIGTRIRERREHLNMSQDELAKLSGYKSRSSINKIELGENDIPQSKIKIIAQALKTTPAFIMGWDENEPIRNLERDKFIWECFKRALKYPTTNIDLIENYSLDKDNKKHYTHMYEYKKIITSIKTGDLKVAEEVFQSLSLYAQNSLFSIIEFSYQSLVFHLILGDERNKDNKDYIFSTFLDSKNEYLDSALGTSKMDYLMTQVLGKHIFSIDFNEANEITNKLTIEADRLMKDLFISKDQLLDYKMLYAHIVEEDSEKANHYNNLLKDKINKQERIKELEEELKILKNKSQ